MEISVRPQSESLSHMFWGFLLGGKEICLCCAPQLQVWVKINHIFSNIFLSAHIFISNHAGSQSCRDLHSGKI